MSFDSRQAICKNCEEREIYIRPDGTAYNCHNHCEKYMEEVKRVRAEKDTYNRKRTAYLDLIGYECDKRERLTRKYGKG